jgi:hypothetical protein
MREKIYIIGNDGHRTSLASLITASRSCTTNRRLGWRRASVKDCEPTPPPTSTTRELGGSVSHAYPKNLMHQQGGDRVKGDQPSRIASSGVMLATLTIAAPNLARRNLLSGFSNQLHISPSKPNALFRAVFVGSVACANSGSRSVSVR